MAVEQDPPPHPVLAALAACESALDEAAVLAVCDPAVKEAALVTTKRVEAKLAALGLRMIAAAGDVAEAHGARDVAAWLAHATHADLAPTRRDQTLAHALDTKWTRVADAMAAGGVSTEQARVIVTALDALPDDLDAQVLARAEAQLVAYAARFTPRQLRILGRRILEVIAPDIVDAEDARRLEDEEQQAREHTMLKMWSRGDGTTGFTGVLPDTDAARLKTYLDAFTTPRKPHGAPTGEEDNIPYPRRLGHALCALLEHLNPARLPTHGGTATMVMVTIPLADLRKDLATADLLNTPATGDSGAIGGGDLSAAQARRLACTAQIIPTVLGGDSETLDQGRARRLYTPAQVKALRLHHRRCRAEGCTIPATWCEAHHQDPWSTGGHTDLTNGTLLCAWHHHRTHDPRYHTETLPNGDLRYHRRR